MRGAQREMTGYFISQGYTPVDRWVSTANNYDGERSECVRRFKLA